MSSCELLSKTPDETSQIRPDSIFFIIHSALCLPGKSPSMAVVNCCCIVLMASSAIAVQLHSRSVENEVPSESIHFVQFADRVCSANVINVSLRFFMT